jgi:hypothetical protein
MYTYICTVDKSLQVCRVPLDRMRCKSIQFICLKNLAFLIFKALCFLCAVLWEGLACRACVPRLPAVLERLAHHRQRIQTSSKHGSFDTLTGIILYARRQEHSIECIICYCALWYLSRSAVVIPTLSIECLYRI